MIMRLSDKLAKKLRVKTTPGIPLDPNPFADWSAHLFAVDRIQFIILMNTASLYTVLIPGKGVTDEGYLIMRGMLAVGEAMAADGYGHLYDDFVAPGTGTIECARALNRSVTGSLNDMVRCAPYRLVDHEGRLRPLSEVSARLNDTPMTAISFFNPRKAMAAMIVGEGGPFRKPQ